MSYREPADEGLRDGLHDGSLRDGTLREGGWLAEYRRSVEMLRWETVAEVGRQPMPPEALSAIALAVAAAGMLALLLPPIPVEPRFWQVCLALTAVWLGAFRIQSQRYARFHDCWRRKVLAHTAVATAVRAPAPRYPLAPAGATDRQRRSGQTSGGVAAR